MFNPQKSACWMKNLKTFSIINKWVIVFWTVHICLGPRIKFLILARGTKFLSFQNCEFFCCCCNSALHMQVVDYMRQKMKWWKWRIKLAIWSIWFGHVIGSLYLSYQDKELSAWKTHKTERINCTLNNLSIGCSVQEAPSPISVWWSLEIREDWQRWSFP